MTPYYREAFEHLLAKVNVDDLYSDTLIFPIGFLCRHYIELRLKQLTRNRKILENCQAEEKINHRIDELWHANRPFIEKTWPNDDRRILEFVEGFIKEFVNHDFSGTEFRYPESTKGHQSLQKLKNFRLEEFKEGIKQLANFLDSICGATEEYVHDQN